MNKTTAISQKRRFAHRSEPSEIRQCAYCRKPFAVKPGSRQIYHDPETEKRTAHERKKALVDLLLVLFLEQPHWRARDMRTVVQRVVYNDAESGWIIPAVTAMGWSYSEKSKRWTRENVV